MGFTQTMIVGTVGSIAAILAAGYWLRASRVHFPDDINNIISALQSASQLNSYAAKAASVAAVCGLIVLWFGRESAYLG